MAYVGMVSASDADLPMDTLAFALTGAGPDDTQFSITPSGALSFQAPPNYELPTDDARFQILGDTLEFVVAPDFELPTDAGLDNVYEVEIQADDGNGLVTRQTVTVSPVNEFPPVFTAGSSQDFTIAEESGDLTVAGDALATDSDQGGDSLTYRIIDGDHADDIFGLDNDWFNLDP